MYFTVRLTDFSLDGKELKLQLWFLSWSKTLYGRTKNNLMALYSIFLQTDNSLFPSLE